MENTFRFHNVGQGLFYSGIICGNNNRTFRFIYDCGTSSSVSDKIMKREIKNLYDSLPNENKPKKFLNILIISHFHDDHVSGLPQLFKMFNVDSVLMPYMNERLKMIAQIEGKSSLQRLYRDPSEWLIERGVRKIFLAGADEDDDIPHNGYDDSDDDVIAVDTESVTGFEINGGVKKIYLRHKASIMCRNFMWEFRFENLRPKPDEYIRYMNVIENFKAENNMTTSEILSSTESMKAIMKLFKEKNIAGKLLNRTSVLMLHKPYKAMNAPLFYPSKSKGVNESKECWRSILTGDAELNQDDSISILERDCSPCLVLQYPHHGSGGNDFRRFRRLFAEFNVLSYGFRNRYGHPDSEVLLNLPHCISVNQNNSFLYTLKP